MTPAEIDKLQARHLRETGHKPEDARCDHCRLIQAVREDRELIAERNFYGDMTQELQEERDELRAWPTEMAKVTGLVVEATPEETADFVADLTNKYVELRDDPRLKIPLDGPGSHRMDLAELRILQQRNVEAQKERDRAVLAATLLIKECAQLREERNELQAKLERLEGHLPDCCKNETCGEDENILHSDVAAMVANTLPFWGRAATQDEWIDMTNMISDLAHKAVKAAIKDREAKLERAKGALEWLNRNITEVGTYDIISKVNEALAAITGESD